MRRTPLTDRIALPRILRTRPSAAFAGAVLALAGLGGAAAAATTTSAAASPAGIAGTPSSLAARDAVRLQFPPAASPHPLIAATPASHVARQALTAADPAHAAASHAAASHAAASHAAPSHAAASHAAPSHAAAGHAHAAHATASRKSWTQVQADLARETTPRAAPGALPAADRLTAGAASGPQSYLPMSASRTANATAIVRQALDKRMGLRAAVVAVATAMQESGLENLSYGDRDSLGLFQQRPSMGWGTASQITTPSYAADAFLDALASHQKADPGWAAQPLWETAQSVQKSGFPYAYAKWETQAAQVVSAIAMKLG